MLRNKVQESMKQAMRDKDQVRLDALRFVWSEIKNAEIDKKEELVDEELMVLVGREVKKRKEAINQMKDGGRDIGDEESKLQVLMEFLPEQMSREEVEKIVTNVVSGGESDFGAVMGQVMGRVKGKADGKMVSEVVKAKLNK